MRLRPILVSFLILFIPAIAYCQPENYNWVFGDHAILRFTGPTAPVLDSSSGMHATEGCASISDAAGNLLFYSNGNSVWNRNHVVMQNGGGLLGNGPGAVGPASSTDGVAIIHAIDNPNRYYVFVLEAAEQIGTGYLRYSVVDMSLDGGFGGVLPGRKNIIIDTNMSEKMTVVKGAGCAQWLLAHKHSTSEYRAFKVDATGLHTTPVTSNIGIIPPGRWNYMTGQMKFSHDRSLLVTTSIQHQDLEVTSFDTVTGILSNVRTITAPPPNMGKYGVAFSPDDKRLYITTNYSMFQYNLALLPNLAAVSASATTILSGDPACQMRNGPDGKLYVARGPDRHYVGVINNPNALGLACNLVINAIRLPGNHVFTMAASYSLASPVVALPQNITGSSRDTTVCLPATLTFSGPSGYNSYAWRYGDTTRSSSRLFVGGDTTWVYSINGCDIRIDTIRIHSSGLSNVSIFSKDTQVCFPATYTLSGPTGFNNYFWNDLTPSRTKTFTTPGVYYIHSFTGCTARIDTFKVTAAPINLTIFTHDTLLCAPDTVTYSAPAGYLSHVWNDNTTVNSKTLSVFNTAWVISYNGCNQRVDTFRVLPKPNSTVANTTTVTLCLPGQTVLQAQPGFPAYTWQDGRTGVSRTVTDTGKYWVRSFMHCTFRVDTFLVQHGATTVTSFRRDTTVCFPATFTLTAPAGYTFYQWNNGTNTNTRAISAPGLYWVISAQGCTHRVDTIRVNAAQFNSAVIRDTMVCLADPVTLQAPGGYTSFLWDDLSVAASRSITATGTYWVQSSQTCYQRTDTFKVRARSYDTTHRPLHDTVLCSVPSITLEGPAGYNAYQWSSGETTAAIQASQSGIYQLTARRQCHIQTDSFKLLFHRSTLNLGQDTSLCTGDTILLQVQEPGTIYRWQDGSTASQYPISRPGRYFVTATRDICTWSDTLLVSEKKIQVSLGDNLRLCLGETSELIPVASAGVNYTWQNGSADPTFLVREPGIYWVAVSVASCSAADTVNVQYEECNCRPFIPTAFTPNNDGRNDNFGAVIACPVSNFKLLVVNRWGQQVFSGFSASARWDGMFNGRPADMGTYFYYVQFTGPRDQTFNFKGDLTLIR